MAIRHQDNAPAKCVPGYSCHDFWSFLERMPLHKRFNRYFSLQHQLQSSRVLLRRTSPIALGCSIKSHEIGKADFNPLRGVADYSQPGAEIKKVERRRLSCGSATHLKDLQS